MTRDELRALAELLRRHALIHDEANSIADFLRQIADATPEHWAVDLRWTDRSKGGDWRRYMTYETAWTAHSTATRSSGLGDIEARVVPLYRLPLED